MSEEVIRQAQEDIKQGEASLKAARDLIDRLKKAGEDTAELESKYAASQARLRRFKTAFEV